MPATPEPTRPREGSTAGPLRLVALLALVVAVAGGTLARAQDEPDAKTGASDEAKAKDDKASDGETAAKEDEVEAEMWGDPLRFELLNNEFKELEIPFLTPNDRTAVEKMATGGNPEPVLIKRYVQHFTGELTRRSSIQSMMETASADSRGARQLEEASTALVRPLLEPVTPNNRRFRQLYVADLLELAPQVMTKHLHTRTFFMVVLSRSKAPEVVPFLIQQIQSPDQPMVVKMLAAVGLVNISDSGKSPLDANSQAIPASQALAGWLSANPDLFWPLKVRALQAMGAMRVATSSPLRGEAELAAVPFEILADREQRPDVRGWAGWALGMMDVPVQVRKFNFELVAYAIGRAAADLGAKILAIPIPDDSPTKNLRLAGRDIDPLLRLLEALAGAPGVPRSGLAGTNHTEAVAARPVLRDIEQRVRAVTTSAIALSRSVGGMVPDAHKRLEADVQELRSYLAKNPPKNLELYPNGPTLTLPKAATAEPKKGDDGAPSR